MRIHRIVSVLAVAGLTCAVASAQVQVREAGTSRATGQTVQAPPQAQPQQQVVSNEFVLALSNRLEAMEREQQELRGHVEEQAFMIRRLQSDLKALYQDIDRRLSGAAAGAQPKDAGGKQGAVQLGLESSSAAMNSAATLVSPPPPAPLQTTIAAPPKGKLAAAASNDLEEKDLYRTALDLLQDERLKPEEARLKAQDAVGLFQSYIDNYPKGSLLTNSLYWQAYAYLKLANPAKAKDVLNRLLTEYPKDPKGPEAMLRMGEAYKQMGDKAKAAETWKGLKTKYPDVPDAIAKAEEFLKGL